MFYTIRFEYNRLFCDINGVPLGFNHFHGLVVFLILRFPSPFLIFRSAPDGAPLLVADFTPENFQQAAAGDNRAFLLPLTSQNISIKPDRRSRRQNSIGQ